MRAWLVILGSVIALLGLGLLVTLFFLTGGPAMTDQVSLQNQPINPHLNFSQVIHVPSGASSVALTWSASGLTNVSFSAATPCQYGVGYCTNGPTVLAWTMAASGKGSTSHVNSTVYLLEATNPSNGFLTFNATVTVTFQSPPPLPTWSWGVIAGGGVVLLAIGGIATFLGLFLPGGVYTRPDAGTPIRRPLDLPPEESDWETDDLPPSRPGAPPP